MINELKKISDLVFRAILPHSAKEYGIFRVQISITIDGTTKPLLIVGNAHPRIEDGDCIAILNPDQELRDKVRGGVAYGAGLKEIVAGRCDAMIHLWIDAYGKNEATIIDKYVSRSPKAAKFEVT